MVPVEVPSRPKGDSESQPSPDLARVIAAWEALPDAIKAGVLAPRSSGGRHRCLARSTSVSPTNADVASSLATATKTPRAQRPSTSGTKHLYAANPPPTTVAIRGRFRFGCTNFPTQSQPRATKAARRHKNHPPNLVAEIANPLIGILKVTRESLTSVKHSRSYSWAGAVELQLRHPQEGFPEPMTPLLPLTNLISENCFRDLDP